MADPQNTLGDLLGKLGLSMGDSESRRQEMIRRLKTVKDPEERDRIIWALSGQSREQTGYRPASRSERFGRTVGKLQRAEKRSAPTGISQGAPTAPPQAPPGTMTPPQLRIGNIVNYVVPILFLFFGISNISRAIEAFRAGAEKEEVFVQGLIGIGFIVFALAGFFSRKMKKTMEKAKGN